MAKFGRKENMKLSQAKTFLEMLAKYGFKPTKILREAKNEDKEIEKDEKEVASKEDGDEKETVAKSKKDSGKDEGKDEEKDSKEKKSAPPKKAEKDDKKDDEDKEDKDEKKTSAKKSEKSDEDDKGEKKAAKPSTKPFEKKSDKGDETIDEDPTETDEDSIDVDDVDDDEIDPDAKSGIRFVIQGEEGADVVPLEILLGDTGAKIVNTETGQEIELPYTDGENLETLLSGVKSKIDKSKESNVMNTSTTNEPGVELQPTGAAAATLKPAVSAVIGTQIKEPSAGSFAGKFVAEAKVAPAKNGDPDAKLDDDKKVKVKEDETTDGDKDNISEAPKGDKLPPADVEGGEGELPPADIDPNAVPADGALPNGAAPPATKEEQIAKKKEQINKLLTDIQVLAVKGIADEIKDKEEQIRSEAEGIPEPSVSMPVDGEVAPEANENFNEDIKALIDGETLTEEFKSKTSLIFSAALNKRLKELKESQNKLFESKVASAVSEEIKTVVATCDKYLNKLTTEWMNENTIAIESGIRNNLTENFIAGLKDLFVKSYVEVPASKLDLCGKLTEQANKFEQDKTRLEKELLTAKESFKRTQRKLAILESTRNLTVSAAEKLEKLAEGVEFKSEAEFRKNLNTLIESYGLDKNKQVKTPATPEGDVMILTEEIRGEKVKAGTMAEYVKALTTQNLMS